MTSAMSTLRTRSSRIACVLMLLYLPACTSWQVGGPTPAQFIEQEKPAQVQVSRTDGSTIVIFSPTIRGDSLIGMVSRGPVRDAWTNGIRLPLSDIRTVAVSRSSTGMTVMIVVVGIIVVGVIALHGYANAVSD